MKHELTHFQKTGSDPSEAGTAKSSGWIPWEGWLGCSGDPGVTDEWKTCITSSGVEDEVLAVRNADSRAWRLTS